MDDRAFIVFSVGPVQSFISAARTLRDLWTGSFLLAWLTRKAMEPIYSKHGAAAFIEPDMSRDPMSPQNLRKEVRSPCLPNRFLAEVPANEAESLAQACRDAFDNAWQTIADNVRQALQTEIAKVKGDGAAEWENSVNRLWNAQVDSFFDVRVTVVPRGAIPGDAVRSLLGERGALGGPWDGASEEDKLWTDQAELAARVHATHKVIRKVTRYSPTPDAQGMYPGKCSLLGTYENLGPAELTKAAAFWQALGGKNGLSIGGVRIRSGERLCAVSFVKRFAWPAYFVNELAVDPRKMRLEDLATVAAAEWLSHEPELSPQTVRDRHGVWSGEWLHWERPEQDEEEGFCPPEVWEQIKKKRDDQGKAPAYYAVLMMDGDRMGKHLRAKPGREHPQSISKALMTFALNYAPKIVEDNHGVLVYCGGDDVLALLPTTKVIACARQLNEAFRKVWSQVVLGGQPGETATVSAGIVVVHYKEDLRFALETARQAEKHAKNNGRDLITITVCRRSGEHTMALCPWPFLDIVQGWVVAFTPSRESPAGASDRWARHLYRELPVLKGLPVDAMKAEIRRQVDRAEESTRKLLSPDAPKKAGAKIVEQLEFFGGLWDQRSQSLAQSGAPPAGAGIRSGQLLENFLTLCQTASFLARRRDE
ncbi:MAG: type III-B CRISPR-associated protein Cas10/Cmr2 [Thermogutta sp.]|uniref:type III-B CRISPR-associated protein Cas10/Cmr2 n=1 Tax=Thermogutta sp. TaxID=1962930 RepID=UPI001997E60D|nr:type III-B CRISPR-associated protein Cas10/Cmr2 [Thermogutta sp.]MBC7350999.1 type III-B CRISPR-associated protein Cas10/Cmr2 [Thermogutta sp.]